MTTLRLALTALLAIALPLAASAAEPGYKIFSKAGSYGDVRDDLKDAIINRGLVVDFVGEIGNMLSRTSHAVGSVTEGGEKSPYRHAQYFQFCAAQLTHDAVSANPHAIVNCPYVMFVYEMGYKPGTIHVSFRLPADAPSKRSREVNQRLVQLLTDIAKEATK